MIEKNENSIIINYLETESAFGELLKELA